MGRSIGYGSLSIWMHHFRDIEYIEDFRPTSYPFDGSWAAARVAAGHTGGEVQTELAKHNAIAITGANLSVGIVGWLTGGGHGPLTQTYGMGADHFAHPPHRSIQFNLITGVLHHARLPTC
jgi:hypothetical protein